MPEDERISGAKRLTVDEGFLREATIELIGAIPWSSNETYVTRVGDGDTAVAAIYKPLEGETPLHDFPAGLFRRERAAFVLARLLGWNFVSTTVIREDAPLGVGSLQLVVAIDGQHYFMLREQPEHEALLRRIALFDLLINNADRKSGHVLRDEAGVIWAIDHGLAFHAEDKLRTVMWDYVGDSFDSHDVAAIREHRSKFRSALRDLLSTEELDALEARAETLVANPVYPEPPDDRPPYPWPLV